MNRTQDLPPPADPLALRTERLGPFPILNHFLERIGIEPLLEKFVPTEDRRVTLAYSRALAVLLRSIVVEREPIYCQGETARTFAPSCHHLRADELAQIGDDRLGRALDRLFDSDRAALLTEVVVAIGKRFSLRFDELHQDTTSIRFCGQFRDGTARIRGKRPPWITYGYSKDHRPDLKQLILALTASADGGVPVQFRCYDGNTNDSETHIETWKTLRRVTGRTDFLYVADSKLCSREVMGHIAREKGRFVTVLPRTRLEDKEFRKWVQSHVPTWEKVWDRPHPRRKGGPHDRWWVHRAELPSQEGWPIIWVHSALLALRQGETRRTRIAAATETLAELRSRLAGPRTRLRKGAEVEERIAEILATHHVGSYLQVRKLRREDHRFRQTKRGRPGPETKYRKITRGYWDVEWAVDEDAVAYDLKSDGMYPLVTNDRSLAPAAVLTAHKGQPKIEKRFAQTKSVYEIAPVFLKNPGRIEAFFTVYFLALVVESLIERELREAMRLEKIEELRIYPEERRCKRPTTDQVFRLFSHTERHILTRGEEVVQVFEAELSVIQRQILDLLGVPEQAYRPPA